MLAGMCGVCGSVWLTEWIRLMKSIELLAIRHFVWCSGSGTLYL